MGEARAVRSSWKRAGGGSSRRASKPRPVRGGSRRGSWRSRIRPRRRPSAMASSPPSSNVNRSLTKRGGQPGTGAPREDFKRTLGRRGTCTPPVMPKCTSSQGRPSSSSQKCLPWRRTARTRRPRSAAITRRGVTPSKTIGSAAHHTPTMRRPTASAAVTRRAASTSGSSGTEAGATYSGTISSSSTSKTSVAPGLIRGGAPLSP